MIPGNKQLTADSYETVFFPMASRERKEFLNIMNGVDPMAWEHLITTHSNTTAMKH